jgi:glutathione S-transferase
MLTLYGDLDSGNVYKVRLLLAQLGIAYRRVDTTQNRGEPATAAFRAINPIGKIPAVAFDDGKMLSESGAILFYFAQDSAFFPSEAWDQANVLRWMFFEQYSHEPYIAVCRFQMFYLGKPASELDPDKVKRGHAALARMERQLAVTPFLVGETVSLADISLLAYTRLAHEGGFDLASYPCLRRWIGETEKVLGLRSVR